MQGELFGHFWKLTLRTFMTSFQYFPKSLNSFWLRISVPDTLNDKESNGADFMSVASLQLADDMRLS